ncbi:MAG: hypothetical protein ABL895_17275 [Cyclobacteriaceae bacterium]
MRVFGIILILLISFSCDTENSFPVPEENYFVKFYGEEGDQEGVDFIVNTDGSIVMIGNTERTGVKKQIYVVKVDSKGQVLWQRRMGLPDKDDFAKDVELHPDGRIVITGETEMAVGDKDVFIKTISQSGDPLDSARYGLPNGTNEEVNSVTIINGGGAFPPGFIVSGSTTISNSSTIRDAMALRFNNSLQRILESGPDPIWTASRYGYSSDDIAFKVVEVDPSTYYVFGYSNRIIQNYNGDYNFWYYALNGDGTTKIGENYCGKTSENEKMTAVEVTFNQAGVRYILSGTATTITSNSAQSYSAALSPILSFSSSDILREKNPTNLGLNTNDLLRVKVKGSFDDSFILISSDTRLPNQGFNIAFVRLKSDLLMASEPFIFGGEGDDFSGSLAELPDGGILISGTMIVGGGNDKGQRKMVLIKLNPEGKLTE